MILCFNKLLIIVFGNHKLITQIIDFESSFECDGFSYVDYSNKNGLKETIETI